MHIFFLVFSMPRRRSILDSRSDKSILRSDRSTSSKSFQTPSRCNNKGSTFQQPVYQNSKEYYIPPQHDYGRVDAYQLCEGFCFQDSLQTQGGFSRDNQLVYGGHNAYRSYERVEGDDGNTDDDANIRDEDEGDSSNERGLCDERAGSNERGVCDEDQDDVPSNHGSTCSP